jgi:hypothetical protein
MTTLVMLVVPGMLVVAVALLTIRKRIREAASDVNIDSQLPPGLIPTLSAACAPVFAAVTVVRRYGTNLS